MDQDPTQGLAGLSEVASNQPGPNKLMSLIAEMVGLLN